MPPYMKEEAQVSFPLFHFMKLGQEVEHWPGKVGLLGTQRSDSPEKHRACQKIIVVFART